MTDRPDELAWLEHLEPPDALDSLVLERAHALLDARCSAANRAANVDEGGTGTVARLPLLWRAFR